MSGVQDLPDYSKSTNQGCGSENQLMPSVRIRGPHDNDQAFSPFMPRNGIFGSQLLSVRYVNLA